MVDFARQWFCEAMEFAKCDMDFEIFQYGNLKDLFESLVCKNLSVAFSAKL